MVVDVHVHVDVTVHGFSQIRLRPGPFEGPATDKPPALPGSAGVIFTFLVEATGPVGAVANWNLPTATDLMNGSVPILCDHQPGKIFGLGTTLVLCES